MCLVLLERGKCFPNYLWFLDFVGPGKKDFCDLMPTKTHDPIYRYLADFRSIRHRSDKKEGEYRQAGGGDRPENPEGFRAGLPVDDPGLRVKIKPHGEHHFTLDQGPHQVESDHDDKGDSDPHRMSNRE